MADDIIPPAAEARLDAFSNDVWGNLDANDVFRRDGPEEVRKALKVAKKPRSYGLPLVDFSKWEGDPPPRQWLWGELLPAQQTTMLTGEGGVGKSLFGQALATHIALGIPFLGQQVEQRNTLYITCEDDEDELWRRQAAICAAIPIPLQALKGKLFLSSLTGTQQTELATFDEAGRVVPTDRWEQLTESCEDHEIGLFTFDNATDAMAGDLNDLHQVAAFVNLLTGLAIRLEGAALIVHHPNKAGGEWLGSVAWHNKVRSRLIIERADEDDPDARVLSAPKANYGPSGGRISFRWHRGSFVRDEDLPPDYAQQLTDTIRANGENSAFLECLRERARQGEARAVGASPGPNYAPSQFEGMTQAKGFKRAALKRAMDRLFMIGAIETYTYRNTAKGRDVTIIREVAEGTPNASPNASRTLPPDYPEQSDRTPPRTHPYTTYSPGAAFGAAPSGQEGEDA